MSPKQLRIVRRFNRLIREAKEAGIVVVADSDNVSIRLILHDEYTASKGDIRGLGVGLAVHDACGGSASVSGAACSFGVR